MVSAREDAAGWRRRQGSAGRSLGSEAPVAGARQCPGMRLPNSGECPLARSRPAPLAAPQSKRYRASANMVNARNISPSHRPPKPSLNRGPVQRRARRAFIPTGLTVMTTPQIAEGRIRGALAGGTRIAISATCWSATASASAVTLASGGLSYGGCATAGTSLMHMIPSIAGKSAKRTSTPASNRRGATGKFLLQQMAAVAELEKKK